jgi:hypothetical protein
MVLSTSYLLENYAGSPPMRAGFVPRAVPVEFGGQSGTRTGFSPKFSPLSNIPQLLHIHLYIICTLDNGPINNQSSRQESPPFSTATIIMIVFNQKTFVASDSKCCRI